MQAELLEPGRSAELNWHWGGGGFGLNSVYAIRQVVKQQNTHAEQYYHSSEKQLLLKSCVRPLGNFVFSISQQFFKYPF